MEVLTRYGWLRVSAKPGMDCVHLFTRFQVPCLPKLGDLDVNVSGKWNHRLSSGEADACAKAVTLFAGIWPRGEHSIAEAEFLGAVGDLLQFIESARWDRHVFQEAAQQWAAKHKALPLRRDCGSLSTDGRSYHICCASCGTDYSDKAAQAFWQLAGSFFFSGDRTIARAQ